MGKYRSATTGLYYPLGQMANPHGSDPLNHMQRKDHRPGGRYDQWESRQAVDLSVPLGTPVYAVTDGVVGRQFGFLTRPETWGYRLHIVTNDNEFYYGHLLKYASNPATGETIKPGDHVKAGQLLGYSGEAGRGKKVAHLHFAVRDMSKVDPADFLDRHKLRLDAVPDVEPAPDAQDAGVLNPSLLDSPASGTDKLVNSSAGSNMAETGSSAEPNVSADPWAEPNMTEMDPSVGQERSVDPSFGRPDASIDTSLSQRRGVPVGSYESQLNISLDPSTESNMSVDPSLTPQADVQMDPSESQPGDKLGGPSFEGQSDRWTDAPDIEDPGYVNGGDDYLEEGDGGE